MPCDEYKALFPLEKTDGLSDDERFCKLLDELIESVKDFREVVITSRTQYFPGQEDQPYELKIRRYGREGFHTLGKLYLSPFEQDEIKCYLNKKYGFLRFWNRRKKKIARSVVTRSPKLMVRPMLLSYIDYLVDDKQEYANTYEIYDELIKKWIAREAEKRKHKFKDRETFRENLYQYSRFVALEIYLQHRTTNRLYLEKEDAIEIARKNNIDLTDYEITGQSLLTRDAEQNWKFAHKSIFEFFLAKESVENLEFCWELNLQQIDMTELFLAEKQPGIPLRNMFVLIHRDQFLMGSPEGEFGRSANETQYPVKLSDFYLAKHTVTVGQFATFISESNYKTDADKGNGSFVWVGKKWKQKSGVTWRCDVTGKEQTQKDHPVIHVSWNDASAYCKWLSKRLNTTFRLPIEAEWEYACRAGTETPFHTGDNLTTDQANYNGDYPYKDYRKGRFIGKTTSFGSYPPNSWGLYDMHGNVWEWCSDWYDEHYYDACKKKGIVENPRGAGTGSNRGLRGGSWSSPAQHCRSANRSSNTPDARNNNIGFRLVFVP